ncbi:MAG: OFA family MFS transporter [Myxococcales bacterium]|nr:OFA family MFS transporter [Myxococcales bacterium]
MAAAATLMQLALGAVYAWSVFRAPLASALGASVTQVNLAFTIANVTLGVAAFVGGLWLARVGPRVVAVTAGVLYGAGVALAGVLGHHLALLYLCYGVLGGAGIGLGYIVPLATLVKWFPDRRGLITGVAVAGFGGGALVFGPLARALIVAHGPFVALEVLGVLFLVIVLAAAIQLGDPPDGYRPPGWQPPALAARAPAPDVGLRGALATWQWYALWLMLFLNVGAGISIIAEAVPMAQELTGAGAARATALVGTIALCNGAGRLVWAALSDRVGRRPVFAALFLIQAAVFALLPVAHGYHPFLALACVCLLCYGGGFGTMPALVADYFGARHVGRIYGLMLTAWSAGAVLGPLIVSHLRDATGQYTRGLQIIAVLMLGAAILPIVLHAPHRATATSRRYARARRAARLTGDSWA